MLLFLGAISLAPFVGSLLLYYFWKPQVDEEFRRLDPDREVTRK